MASIDYNDITNIGIRNLTGTILAEEIPINDDQNINTLEDIVKIDEEIVASDLFAYDPTIYSFCKENSIFNILKVGESGTIEFQTEITDGLYGITILPESADNDYDQLLEQLAAAVPETTQWSNRRPNIGDLVFGQTFEGYWIRGYVVTVLPYLKVAMVDEGKVEVVYNLATVEKPLTDICTFSGLCQLSDPTHKFLMDDVVHCKVLRRTLNGEPDEFEVLLVSKDIEMKANVKPWIPMPQQLGVVCTEVPTGSEVCVTGYRNHIYLYVRPLHPLGVARYNFIMETVAKCAAKSPFLKHPRIGLNALALLDDGNYYRVSILNVQATTVKVSYHDLGRREEADRSTLKVYPDCLDKIGYCITKVYLRDIPRDIPPFIPIINILDSLMETKVTLTCWYDGLPNVEGVYLKYPNGETVNNAICKTLEPSAVYPSKGK